MQPVATLSLSSWLSRERAAGYEPAVLQSGRVLLGGAGAGANNAALTLGLSQLGELLIVDFDRFESHNATRAPLYPTPEEITAFGVAKARVLAEKVARLSQVVPGVGGSRTRYHDGYVQELPTSVFGRVDVVLNGADNQAARAFLAEQAFLAGRPFIDAGFNGSLLRIGVFIPKDPARDPCWRCRYPDYTINDKRYYSCERFARDVERHGMVPAVQATAQVAGALQAAWALQILHGDQTRSNTVFSLDIAAGDSSTFAAVRNPKCPSRWHGLAERQRRVVAWTPRLTWGELVEQVTGLLGVESQLKPLAPLVETMQCVACERFMDVHASAWLYEAVPRCRQCDGVFARLSDDRAAHAESYYEWIDFTRPDLLPQTLADFGIGPGDLFLARPFGERTARPVVIELDGQSAPLVDDFFQTITSAP